MSRRYLLTHPQWGVYLGNCMGLGFWSDLDPVDQPAAVTFASPGEAMEHAASWAPAVPEEDLQVRPVQCAADDGYATREECMAAGCRRWEITPRREPVG